MTLRLVLESDDEVGREIIELVQHDKVLFCQVAIHAAQLLLTRAAKTQGVREHYDSIHMRAKATRDAKRDRE